MTQAAVATQVHQALDLPVDFATQITFNGELGHFAAQQFDLPVGEILGFCGRIYTGSGADGLATRAANTIDVVQRDTSVLVSRNVNACNTGHSVKLQLTATQRPGSQEKGARY